MSSRPSQPVGSHTKPVPHSPPPQPLTQHRQQQHHHQHQPSITHDEEYHVHVSENDEPRVDDEDEDDEDAHARGGEDYEAVSADDGEEDTQEEYYRAAHQAAAAAANQPQQKMPHAKKQQSQPKPQPSQPHASDHLQTPQSKYTHASLDHSPPLHPSTPYLDDEEVSGIKTVPSTPPLTPTINPQHPPKKLLDAGLAAMKKNLIPGLALQCIALLIIIIYYSSSSAQDSFQSLAEVKEDLGFGFSFLSTAIFGGFLPWLINAAKKEYERQKQVKMSMMTADLHMTIDHPPPSSEQPSSSSTTTITTSIDMDELPRDGLILTGSEIPIDTFKFGTNNSNNSTNNTASHDPTPIVLDSSLTTTIDGVTTSTASVARPLDSTTPKKPTMLSECLFYTIFWGLKGMEVDAFYRLQEVIWGSGSDPWTIIGKVFTDQFIYNPPWSTPSVIGAYMWMNLNFDFRLWWSKFATKHFWCWSVPECLISMWMVWIPACTMIYCLPGPLQLPLQNIVLCFWSLILAMLSSGGN